MYVVPVCVVDAAYGYGALITRRSGGSRQSCQSLAVGLIAFVRWGWVWQNWWHKVGSQFPRIKRVQPENQDIICDKMVAPVFRTDPVVPVLCSLKLLPATKVLHMVENASKAHRSSSATSAVFGWIWGRCVGRSLPSLVRGGTQVWHDDDSHIWPALPQAKPARWK